MKRSKKVTIGILIFFVIVATVIGGRTAMGVYFKKKFGKRPPPGVVVEIVQVKEFSKTIESYCTALSSKTTSFKIKKSELLEPLKLSAPTSLMQNANTDATLVCHANKPFDDNESNE